MHHKESRATLGGKLSAVLVAAGSSVGLGNIWRFPYVAGDNGGGAFLIIYILCVLLLGLPLMIAEFTVGRASHRNAVGAYRALNPRWSFLGYNGVLAAFLILGFYFVVSGWTAEYMVHSVTGSIARFSTAEQYKSLFENFISNPWRPVVYTCLFVLATHFVIAMGVQKGIERSAKILMPLLFLILIVLSVHSLLMPGGEAGLKFLFAPDFSKVTPTTVLVALGQAFFSLSIGIGTMVTYASYFKPDTNLRHTALNVTILDTLVAILAGVVIFPAVFSVGIEPSSGPSLVFITLPSIFNGMPLSMVWSSIFFLLLVVAGIAVAGCVGQLEDRRALTFRFARLPDGQHPAAGRRAFHLHLRGLEARPPHPQGTDHQRRRAEIPHLRPVQLPAPLRLPGRAAADLPRQPRRILTRPTRVSPTPDFGKSGDFYFRGQDGMEGAHFDSKPLFLKKADISPSFFVFYFGK